VACQQQISISAFNHIAGIVGLRDDDCVADYCSKTINLGTQLDLDSLSLLERNCSFGFV
jgi:hypothetical protein